MIPGMGGGLSNQQSSSSGASSGPSTSNWYQGDFAVSWADGAATTGSRAGLGASGASALGIPTEILIAGAIVLVALLWKRSR